MNNTVPIIYYHSVAPRRNRAWSRSWLTHELRFFVSHLEYFKRNKYKAISLSEFFELGTSTNKYDKLFLLTFDDGYADNFIYVYPLLKKYGFMGTIFINPGNVDERAGIRKTLNDYWDNKASLNEIEKWGFLSWEEMKVLEESRVIDIQSHTFTHSKYFVSDKIVGFHHPGADCLYPISNLFPHRTAYYITDHEFEKLIPYGYPLFESKSSVIAKKAEISPKFNKEVLNKLKNHNWSGKYDFQNILRQIKPIYDEFRLNGELIIKLESEAEYQLRVRTELELSKVRIEAKLGKRVDFLCWPHGDNNNFAHNTAIKIGYKATTLGNADSLIDNQIPPDRIPPRFGLSPCRNSRHLTYLKTRYKIGSYEKTFPYFQLDNLYHRVRYGAPRD